MLKIEFIIIENIAKSGVLVSMKLDNGDFKNYLYDNGECVIIYFIGEGAKTIPKINFGN